MHTAQIATITHDYPSGAVLPAGALVEIRRQFEHETEGLVSVVRRIVEDPDAGPEAIGYVYPDGYFLTTAPADDLYAGADWYVKADALEEIREENVLPISERRR